MLRCLSPATSALIQKLRSEHEIGKRGEAVHTVAGAKAAQAAFEGIYAGARKKASEV